jgi:gamma-glutamylcyclotransferase (GGCT)/AIG2-like uncharacterized protein YtfP
MLLFYGCLHPVAKNAIVDYMNNDVTAPSDTLLFFAYGTLRKDGALYEHWLKDLVVDDLGKASLRFARLFYPTDHKRYPYCVWTGKFDDEAVGEVFEVVVNSDLAQMLSMEVSAGYRLSEGEVTLADGTQKMALICTWDKTHGQAVPDNDWLSAERAVWW